MKDYYLFIICFVCLIISHMVLFKRDAKIERLEDERAAIYSELNYMSSQLCLEEQQFEDIVRLSYAAYKECSICPVEEQKDVVKVFLSRVGDPRFPNTLKQVLTQKGAVHAVNEFEMDKWVSTFKAARSALFEPRDSQIVGYYRPDTATNKKWVEKMSKKVVFSHKFHNFHKI